MMGGYHKHLRSSVAKSFKKNITSASGFYKENLNYFKIQNNKSLNITLGSEMNSPVDVYIKLEI